MATKVTRLLDEDVARVCMLSGLAETVPFWAKFHAVLDEVERGRAEGDLAARIVAGLTGGA
ncbi:MAG: hypothetical protein LC624_04645 [Halobacteriales archaeon]|nr:hypothetical protein [Halobacteriales archaeon]